MGRIHLITGGIKSGKSDFAVRLASELAADATVRFIATAHRGIGDVSLDQRIDRHIEERPDHWTLFQPPVSVVEAITASGNETAAILDCVTLWIGDLVSAQEYSHTRGLRTEVERLVDALRDADRPTFVITNEVGSGVAPPTTLGNDYADELGSANRQIANSADEVTLLVAGQPLKIK